MQRLCLATLLLLGAFAACSNLAHAQKVADVRRAGRLECGTVQNSDDWDGGSIHGDLSAFEGEICRAVAVAILGDRGHLDLHPFPAENEGFQALQAGRVSLVVGLSPSASTAVHFGVEFGKPVFYDSQRILLSKLSGITQLTGLREQLICALDMSAPERTLHDVMAEKGVPFALMTHSEQGEMDAAIAVRHCAAGTGMETRLAQSRANFHALTSDFVFLPNHLALGPIAPAYRYGDQTFGLIVDWTVNALVEAEALGITQANISQVAKRDDMRAEQLSGHDFATAQALGLSHDWAIQVIAATGNYGEIFQRTVGGPYHLERGLNALWTEGGLMYSPPMR